MRVAVDEMTVVGPSGGRVDIKNASAEGNGTFFGVVKGVLGRFEHRASTSANSFFLIKSKRTRSKQRRQKCRCSMQIPSGCE
jgi:hypothetical protein